MAEKINPPDYVASDLPGSEHYLPGAPVSGDKPPRKPNAIPPWDLFAAAARIAQAIDRPSRWSVRTSPWLHAAVEADDAMKEREKRTR